jgi:hypothetical protein
MVKNMALGHVLQTVLCVVLAFSPGAWATCTEDLLTMIAVVEEGGPATDALLESWLTLRTKYPDRPFCVLKVGGQCSGCAQGEIGNLLIPPEMALDPYVFSRQINRDNGDEFQQSDWFDRCHLNVDVEFSRTTVALLVDLPLDDDDVPEDVSASYAYFMTRIERTGLKAEMAGPRQDHNYIEPFNRGFCSDPVPDPFVIGNTVPATAGQTANMFLQSGSRRFENIVCGCIQAVLAHPTNPDICFAGSVNGGVFRTTSCTADLPDWKPLTDSEESLSVGDMVFDVTDTTGNTVLVAIGARSSFARAGGKRIGLLYTRNALGNTPTWTILDNDAGDIKFRDNKVEFNSVFARGTLMLASAYGSGEGDCASIGIFRSTDRGITWTNVLSGVGRAVASDPNNPARFYATLDSESETTFTPCSFPGRRPNGVFTSDDDGTTWTITSPVSVTDQWLGGQLNNAKLSVSADRSRVWSALLREGQADSISYSDDNGVTWTRMDNVTIRNDGGDVGLNPRRKPGGAGDIHFSLLASPTNRDEMYVGGDRQDGNFPDGPPNFIGAFDYTGVLFRGDASVPPTDDDPSRDGPSPQWEHMTNLNSIAEVPQGGTASGSGPHADSRDMELRADGSILEGDDGGVAIRTNPGDNTGDWRSACGNMQVFESHNVAYEPLFKSVLFGNQDTGSICGTLGVAETFRSVATADGNDCMIDYKSDADVVYFYYGTQTLAPFFLRARFNKTTNAQIGNPVSLNANLPGNGGFLSITAMNPVSQNEFAVAIDAPEKLIAYTTDRGDSFSELTTPESETISAMIWSADGTRLYAVESRNNVFRCVKPSLACTARGTIGTGGVVKQLAVNSGNSNIVYAAATSFSDFQTPQAFMSMDGGATWDDITVEDSLLDNAALGSSVVYLANKVAFGTSNGVLVPDGGVGVGWRVLAPGLPTVAIVDMVYEPMDDTLVVATFGRGVW